ncbi:MAG: hypothetical protein HQL35_14190, partial [Alphaproteobacteria bacterium]|nr:hypothetical protein [Alphaproteobacteria bacterium]
GLGLEIPNLEAFFRWEELLDARVGTLDVSGLRLSGRVTEGRLSFGDMDAVLFAPASGDSGALAVPFRSLRLRDALVVIQAPAGTVELRLDGTVSRGADGGVALETGRVRATTPWGRAQGRAEAAVTAARRISARFDLEDGAFDAAGITGDGVAGRARLSGGLDDLAG